LRVGLIDEFTLLEGAICEKMKRSGLRPHEDIMSQAIVDPLELRRFAHHLKQFNGDLRERISGLHAEMTRLSDTWRDQEHEKFTQEFEATLHVIEHFLETADQHVPFLQRKAERIEEYLSQH
jgi:uncharacterized protein YukE